MPSAIAGYLGLGAGIGLAAGLSPGPILTLVVAETLRVGWLRGAAIGAGPLLADGPIILAALLTLSRLPDGFDRWLALAGSIFLLLMAGRQVRRLALPRPSEAAAPAAGGFLTGLLARALTPHAYLFWFLVGGPLLAEAAEISGLAPPAFLFGYYLTIVGSNLVLAVVLARYARGVPEGGYRALLLVSAAVLAAYAAVLAKQAIAL
jgi:threonine/homoserine/homoserine lactone efflux protein